MLNTLAVDHHDSCPTIGLVSILIFKGGWYNRSISFQWIIYKLLLNLSAIKNVINFFKIFHYIKMLQIWVHFGFWEICISSTSCKLTIITTLKNLRLIPVFILSSDVILPKFKHSVEHLHCVQIFSHLNFLLLCNIEKNTVYTIVIQTTK